VSPETPAYKADHLSSPAGSFFWTGVDPAGIAYNTTKVSAADAPKTWQDILNPRWKGSISCKISASGLQFVQWYTLRKLYGAGFWKEFAKQNPHAFDSRVQLFDRLAKGDDTITAIGEYPAYILFKDKGAKVEFVAPADGLPATPLIVGAVSKAPHPEAAKLFVDWAMSKRGQAWYQTNPNLYYGSVRTDAPPMRPGCGWVISSCSTRRLGRLRGEPRCLCQGMETHCSACERSSRAICEIANLRSADGWVWSCGRCGGTGPVPGLLSFQAALDVGDPQVRPPTAYGFDNFNGIFQYPQILLNTLTVSVAATVMALLFGFVMAWILTRTNVPGRYLFEQLMAVPYYLTPLLGGAGLEPARLARKRLHQPGLARHSAALAISSISIRRTESPGHGAVRGLRRIRHDSRCYEVDGPCA